jgi:hypothetical protein
VKVSVSYKGRRLGAIKGSWEWWSETLVEAMAIFDTRLLSQNSTDSHVHLFSGKAFLICKAYGYSSIG